jgi:adenine-specific DNA-methyltransferase
MQPDLFLEQRTSRAPTASLNLNSELGQWFTPAWAAEELTADALGGYGRVGVIEPSCGDGAFLSAVPRDLAAIGVEIDPRIAAAARLATGREVVCADFATADVTVPDLAVILGNPPYSMPIIDAFVMRSHELLPEDGLCALLLPAHVLSTTSRVNRWAERFSIEQRMVPRSLFPRISLPLVWTRFVKSKRRTMVGFMLFDQQTDVESMPKSIRRALGKPGTWREAVGLAIHSLGGEATLTEIYRAIEPRRPSGNAWWKPKVRQTCALYFERTGLHTFSLPRVQ